MKKTIYHLIIISIVLLQSCLKDDDQIFENSSAERMSGALEEYSTVLTGSPNGWLMEYYPEEDYAMGGYTFLCLFNSSGEVTVASEISTDNYEPGDQVTSLYKLISNEGPVLTFDTYNEVFHNFAEPNSSDVDGYSGDYEFVIVSASADSIVMKGKKYNNEIVMTPLPADTDWDEYIREIVAVADESAFGAYLLSINGGEAGSVSQSNRVFTIEYTGGSEIVTTDAGFIYTATGIKLREPLTLGGVTMRYFDWNGDESTYTCTDEGVTATLVVDLPENYLYYRDYVGSWLLDYYIGNTVVTVSQKVKNKTLTVSGLDFDFVMNYDMATGKVDINSQSVGTYGNYTVWLCAWDPSAGYLSWSPSLGMISEWDGDTDPITLTFTDNGVWGTYVVDGFLFWMLDSSGSSAGRYTGGNYRYPYLTMIKQ